MRTKSTIIREHALEIEKYCLDNGLSSDKVFVAAISWNDKAGRVFILGPGDPERAKLGLMDDIPLPVALEIYLEKDGTLRFEQTEFTHRYLGSEVPVEEPAMV